MGAPREANNLVDETFTLPRRALRALEVADNLSPGLRACVHEFGSAIVQAFLLAGIKDPKRIRILVHECWEGARQPAQRNRVGRLRSPVIDNLDWILVQAKAEITAERLLRVLWQHSMVIVPREPSTVMVDASMNALKEMGLVSKSQKHLIRLRAAIKASAASLWPHLFDPFQ